MSMSGSSFAPGFVGDALSPFPPVASGQAMFGGMPGGAAALLATMAWPASGASGADFVPDMPRVLPVAPAAPSLQPPFAEARGRAEVPATVTASAVTLQSVLDRSQTDRLEPFFAYLGADLAWPAAKLCLVAEIDLEGALEHYDPPLMPFQRAEIVEVIRGVFSENGFEIPRMGCALPAPAPKTGAPTEPQHSQTTGQSQQTPVQEPSFDQAVALSDTIDQSLRGTAKLMFFFLRSLRFAARGTLRRQATTLQRNTPPLRNSCLPSAA